MSQVQVIPVSNEDIRELRIAPVRQFLQPYLDDPAKMSQLIKQQISFDIQFMMQEDDPREFCDVPEIRLWFLRLDAAFPWLPAMLELRSGTLALYSAMLVPHVMDRQGGLQFDDQALDLFLTYKSFICYQWLKENGVGRPSLR